MRAQDLHLKCLFHRPTHCLLELFANVIKVKYSRPTDLTTLDSVWYVQAISTWNFR